MSDIPTCGMPASGMPTYGAPTGDTAIDGALGLDLAGTPMVPDYYAPSMPLPAAIPGIPAADDIVW